MSADPSLFDTPAAPREVDAAAVGAIKSILITDSGAEIKCAKGTVMLSVEQFFYLRRTISSVPIPKMCRCGGAA